MKSDALAQRINEIFNEDLEIEEIYQALEALNRELEKVRGKPVNRKGK